MTHPHRLPAERLTRLPAATQRIGTYLIYQTDETRMF